MILREARDEIARFMRTATLLPSVRTNPTVRGQEASLRGIHSLSPPSTAGSLLPEPMQAQPHSYLATRRLQH